MASEDQPRNPAKNYDYNIPPRFIIYDHKINTKRHEESAQNQPDNKAQDRWPKWNAVATTTATVGIMFFTAAAVCVGVYQWRAIKGQLREMHEQTVTTRAQVRANIAANDFKVETYIENGSIGGWEITPHWQNNGTTDAHNLRQWWGIGFTDVSMPLSAKIRCSPLPAPPDVRPVTIQAGHPYEQLAQRISIAQLQEAAVGKGTIIIQGHLDYFDIFPGDPAIALDWCARVIPNDIPAAKASFLDLEAATRQGVGGADHEIANH